MGCGGQLSFCFGTYRMLLSPTTHRIFVVFALCAGLAAAQEKPLTPQQAAETMQLPEGFRVSVFAAEPHLVQPISFTFDDRGRLWVVQCLSYP